METWGVVFLGIMALASLVQAGFIVAIAMGGRRLSRRVDEIQQRLDRDIRPTLDQIGRMSRNFAEISDLAVLQARRIDDVIADTLDKVEETTAVMRQLVLKPLGPLANVMALLRGIRRGLEVFQQLRGLETQGRPRRPYVADDDDDEHLFI